MHDIGTRVNRVPRSLQTHQYCIVSIEIIILENERAEIPLQAFPRFDLVEELEQDYAEKYLSCVVRQVVTVDNVPD